MTEPLSSVVTKVPTGIAGFDRIALGGLPAGRATLVAGTTGSGKTVFAAEFLARGIRLYGEGAVFVTFEEDPADIRTNLASLDFDVAAWEAEGRWAFVDASPGEHEQAVVGSYDLDALVARVAHAVRTTNAKRVVIDSVGAPLLRYPDPAVVRAELVRLAASLRKLGVTSIMTAERPFEDEAIARHGVEEFAADNVVLLRNVIEQEKRRRTVEILKFRGADHRSGEFSFAIVAKRGISVIPVALIGLRQRSSTERISLGNTGLDAMVGGAYRDSVTFVSGPTGSGKTLLATTFAVAAVEAGERALLVSYEESRDQLLRNASSWGFDLAAQEDAGLLRVVSEYPEVASLEDHFVTLRTTIGEFEPRRVAIDNVSALERVATNRGMRDFVIGLTALLRQSEISTLLTAGTGPPGTESVTETHASALSDVILLLRHVEVAGALRRALCVLKVRGSPHDTRIHEFEIDDRGLRIREPYSGLTGILAGAISPWPAGATAGAPEHPDPSGNSHGEGDG